MVGDTYRLERDSMGEVKVPANAYYGAQTQRAVENFPVSGIRFPRDFIQALGMIKLCAARVNLDLGLLDRKIAGAITVDGGYKAFASDTVNPEPLSLAGARFRSGLCPDASTSTAR